MTTLDIVTTISSSANPAVNLDTGGYDSFLVESFASVFGTGPSSNGIGSTAVGIIGTIDGTVNAHNDGVNLSGGAAKIGVGSTGSVGGEIHALAFGAGGDGVDNAGVITSAYIAIAINDGGLTSGNVVTNSGLIEGDSYVGGGAGISITGGGGNSITNSGLISGSYGINIIDGSTDAADAIVNTGTIAGTAAAIVTGQARAAVTNKGSIFGQVSLEGADSVFVNQGTVHGDATFRAARARYDGSAGSLTGSIVVFGGGVFVGGAQADRFVLNVRPASTTRFNGGAGPDMLTLNADFSSGWTFSAATIVNIETLTLHAGHSYRLTFNDATVAAGRRLTVDASTLLASDSATLDASAETDGACTMIGGSGSDTFVFKATHFSSADVVQGGAGATDTLRFSGPGMIAASALAHTRSVEAIVLANGTNSLRLTNALVGSAASSALTVLGGAGADAIDAGAVTSGAFMVKIDGAGGADKVTAGGGADHFVYSAVGDSTGASYDTVVGADFSHDKFETSALTGAVSVTHAPVTGGALSTATFNADLAAAIGASRLGAHHAVEFTAISGTLAGDTFVVVDANGVAGYQADADLVIRLSGATGTLTAGNFI